MRTGSLLGKFYVMRGSVTPWSHKHYVLYCPVCKICNFFPMATEVTMETDVIAQILSNLKFHTVCISQISVFEVVLKHQSQTIYITNMSVGHTFISLFMGCYIHVGKFKYALLSGQFRCCIQSMFPFKSLHYVTKGGIILF